MHVLDVLLRVHIIKSVRKYLLPFFISIFISLGHEQTKIPDQIECGPAKVSVDRLIFERAGPHDQRVFRT